ncbi:MAG: hypothetical protein A2882_15505 [Phenylobacterium sp. RIFCSPHIGHO2_01_FULL_70_10]|nr:MAG: hypothetical protein A2882_15505 [Phenylobacterium sp. RIFCSPHIGHO2_01_FULL_70_10]
MPLVLLHQADDVGLARAAADRGRFGRVEGVVGRLRAVEQARAGGILGRTVGRLAGRRGRRLDFGRLLGRRQDEGAAAGAHGHRRGRRRRRRAQILLRARLQVRGRLRLRLGGHVILGLGGSLDHGLDGGHLGRDLDIRDGGLLLRGRLGFGLDGGRRILAEDGLQAIADGRGRGLGRTRLGLLLVGRRRQRRRRLGIAHGDGLDAFHGRANRNRRLARHDAGDVGVDIGPQHRRGRRHPAVHRRQEEGLLGRAAAHEGVDHDPLALEVRLAPELHAAGGLQELALVEATQHGRAAEIVQPDVEGEAAERVELILIERRVGQVVDRMGHRNQVVEQQGLGVLFRDFGALAGGQRVAVADRPAAVRQPGGLGAVALEPLDQVDRGAGDLVTRFHGRPDPSWDTNARSALPIAR